MKKKAYLVPTFHHDIAYLRPETEYTAGCFKILDEALYILENNPEYCFFMEQAWLLDEYWEARPEKHALMRKLAAEKRFTIEPGLYAVPDMNLPDGESLYMHAKVGRKIAKDTLGYAPRVCMIADCWGHHAQIPQILSSCGYDYYSFSRCMREDVDRQNYIWKGLDGSTIRAHWMSTHYDGIRFPSQAEQENVDELSWADAGADGINKLMAQNRVKCGDDPQYLPVGGDMTFPSRLAPELVKGLNERDDLPELVFSSPAAAFDAIDWGNEPVFDGEFESSMQGTFTTNIIIKQLNRKYAGELFTAEALSAVLGKKEDFDGAWKLYLKNQFHDIACGTICDKALSDVEADYRALGHMITNAKRRMSTGEGEKAYFNSLPFERKLTVDEGVITLKPLGFTMASEAVKPENATCTLPFMFENEFYTAKVGADGYINSLTDKASGRQLVKQDSVAPFGALVMQMDYGDSWWEFEAPFLTRTTQAYVMNRPDPLVNGGRRSFMPETVKAEIEYSDADRVVVKQTGTIRFWVTVVNFTTTITFSKSERMIRYNTKFTNTCKDFRLRAAFSTDGLTSARRQIPFGTMPMPDGVQASQRFVEMFDDKAALAVINRGTPAYSVDNDILFVSLFRAAAMEYKCQSYDSYGIGRDYSFDYAVLAHEAGNETALWNGALDFNTPVYAMPAPEYEKSISVKGAQLSALRNTEDGVFARVYNPTADENTCEVYVCGAEKAYITDGLGNAISELPITDGKTVLNLGAYKVCGILFV